MIARQTRIVPVDAASPDPDVLREAAAVIRAGGLVAFPTETVYGLGANALDAAAVRGIFTAKGRPATNPLIVHVDGEPMLRRVAAAWPSSASALAARFWPGPLTMVLPKSDAIPDVVTGGGPTVAVRMPGHPVALGLIRAAGVPLAAPSANRSSELSPTRAEHVRAGLDGSVDLILDGGPTPNGIESTVLSLAGDQLMLLRPGPIGVRELEAVIGPVALNVTDVQKGPLPSPGMLARHYSPRTPLELFPNRDDLAGRAAALVNAGMRVVSLVVGPGTKLPGIVVSLPADSREYAARLYSTMHEIDERGFSRLLVELPPDADEWAAVRDRLRRAATL